MRIPTSLAAALLLLLLIAGWFSTLPEDEPTPAPPTDAHTSTTAAAATPPIADDARARVTFGGGAGRASEATEPEAAGAETVTTDVRVLSPDGNPLEGARVYLYQGTLTVAAIDAPTDATGVVTFAAVQDDTGLVVRVVPFRKQRDDLLVTEAPFTLGKDMDVVVERALHVSGVVVDAAGAPVTRVPISFAEDVDDFLFGTLTTYTDETGRFDVGGRRAGATLHLVAGAQRSRSAGRHPDHALPDDDEIVAATAGDSDVRLTLPENSTMTVHVTGGSPSFRMYVKAIDDRGWAVMEPVISGRVFLSGLSPDRTYSIHLRYPRSGLVAHAVGARPGDTIDLPLVAGAELSGTITSAHAFAEYFDAKFQSLGETYKLRVADDGTFSERHLPAAAGVLSVRSWGGGKPELVGTAEVTPGEPITLVLTPK